MIDMEPKDGNIYPQMRISQLGVGELEIHAMAYTSGDNIYFCHDIIIRDAKADKEDKGWGKAIFRGSLENLIDLVRIASDLVVPAYKDEG